MSVELAVRSDPAPRSPGVSDLAEQRERAAPDETHRPRLSVVIPAHDEADRIVAGLQVLLADAQPGEFDVVVVCNGCRDDTATRARTVPGVRVREIAAASKIAALREGDASTAVFPRIYLDADVALTTDTARALAASLQEPGVLVAGVPAHLRLDAAPVPVQLFFEFRQRLPVLAHGIHGAGMYALSEAGRARLGDWPEVTGDDQFVFRSFGPEERVTLSDRSTQVEPPPDLRAVVRRSLRVRRGNRQLTLGGEGHAPLAPPPAGFGVALRDALRSPRGIAAAVTFVGVTSVVRVLDRLGARADW